MTDSIKISPMNFKATLNYSKITENAEKWAEVAKDFSKKTAGYPKFELAINDQTDSLIIKKIKEDKTKVKLVKGTFKKEGGLQSLLKKGTDYTTNYLKKFIEKNVKEQIKEDQAYALAEKIEKRAKRNKIEDFSYFPDDVFGGF